MNDHVDGESWRGPSRLPRRAFTGAALTLLAAPLAIAPRAATAATTSETAANDAAPSAAAPARATALPRLFAPGGPVRIEGRDELVGEIHVACPAGEAPPSALRLTDADRDVAFAEFEDAVLAKRLARIDGDRLVVHLELRSSAERPLPARLVPLLTSREGRQLRGEPFALAIAAVPAASALGPPLGEGLWVAIHDPAWERGHRRVGFHRAGRWTIPGRHAIDFVRVDPDGRVARGDSDRPTSHFGYGAPVLAVADGIVSAARNDMAEAGSIAGNPRHPLIDGPGNHVVLTLADTRHVIYEHLRPGSLTVRAGDRVRQGQVLGELGFTGDSTGPHLHFHVCDEGAPNSGEGLPFVFERFERLGGYEDLSTLGRARWQAAPQGATRLRLGEKPASHRVVRFTTA